MLLTEIEKLFLVVHSIHPELVQWVEFSALLGEKGGSFNKEFIPSRLPLSFQVV